MTIRYLIRKFLITALLFSLLSFPTNVQAQNTSTGTQSKDCLKLIVGGGATAVERIARAVSKELSDHGVCNSLRFVPSKRATIEFLKGDADGEFGRIQFYKEIVQSQAVMVPTPLLGYHGVLLTRDNTLRSVSEITGQLGIVRGWLWMRKVSEANPEIAITEADSLETLVKMFESNRVQAILLPDAFIGTPPLIETFHHIKVIDINVHLWLRSRHTYRVAEVDKVIADFINAGGRFENYPLD